MSGCDAFFCLLVVLMQFFFAYRETFNWVDKVAIPLAGLSPACASETVALGRNMGLYNALFGLGMAIAMMSGSPWAAAWIALALFIAGLVGGYTVNKRIYAQAGLAGFTLLILAT